MASYVQPALLAAAELVDRTSRPAAVLAGIAHGDQLRRLLAECRADGRRIRQARRLEQLAAHQRQEGAER